MTFGVSADRGRLEWAGTNLGTVFAQPDNLFSPRFIGMIRDLLRFNSNAARIWPNASLRRSARWANSLDAHNMGSRCGDLYLVPMAASIWSTRADEILDYPAATFCALPEPFAAAGEQPAGVALGAERFTQLRAAHPGRLPDCRHGAAAGGDPARRQRRRCRRWRADGTL